MIQGIYAICDTSFSPGLSHLELAQRVLSGGVSILQLRMKGETDLSKIEKVAREILTLKKDFNFTFILNDQIELAAELAVDGLHLGQDDGTIASARAKIGPKKIIGYSAHSLAEALAAETAGADYIALGAIFPTQTKGPGHPVQGIETLRSVVQAVKKPVVAIGGINQGNFLEVANTGVAAIAMITALSQAADITKTANYFVKTWNF